MSDEPADFRKGRQAAADDVAKYRDELVAELEGQGSTGRTMALIAREWLTIATDIADCGYSMQRDYGSASPARGGV